MLKIEKWRPIKNWEGLYEVSNLGRVRSVDRKYLTAKYGTTSCFKGRVLKQGWIKNGYRVVGFTRPKRLRKDFYVHHLVLRNFIGPCPKNQEACHNDGVRHHNSAANLRWDTRSSNALDRHRHGTMTNYRGERANSAKLNWKKITWIREHAQQISARKMGKRFGVCHRTIMAVIKKESWK